MVSFTTLAVLAAVNLVLVAAMKALSQPTTGARSQGEAWAKAARSVTR